MVIYILPVCRNCKPPEIKEKTDFNLELLLYAKLNRYVIETLEGNILTVIPKRGIWYKTTVPEQIYKNSNSQIDSESYKSLSHLKILTYLSHNALL